MTEILLLIGAALWAAISWFLLFGRKGAHSWPRTWLVAGGLIGYAVVALAVLGRLDDVVGPVGLVEAGIGLGVGSAWLAATHVGHAVICRWSASFSEQVRDLYRRGLGEPPSRILGPIVAMAVAEELFFRGLVQGQAGIVVGVAVYTVVQFAERKWALALAALLGGTLWGGLFAFTGGLVAPVVAHVLWTTTLTLVWPLRGCGGDDIATPADHVGQHV